MLFDIKLFPEFRAFNKENQIVLFDVISTRLLQIDDLLLKVIVNVQRLDYSGLRGIKSLLSQEHDGTEIEKAWNTMLSLVSRGILVPVNAVRREAITSRARMNAILLNVSHSCQLKCAYCFAEGGHYGKPDQEVSMCWDIAKAAIDMLDFVDEEGYILRIGFFGGEPLQNWEVIKRAILYTKERANGFEKTKVFLTMTTNGIGLTPSRAKFLHEHDCRPMMSIDGCESTHNVLRPAKDPCRNSWEGTIAGLRSWQQVGGEPLTARATITSKDLDILSMVELFRKIGFGNINTQLVQTEDPDLKLSLEQIHSYEYQQLKILHDDISKSADFGRVYNALLHSYRRNRFCGVGYSSYAVEPNGDIYLCHRFASDTDYKVGNVFKGLDQTKLDGFRQGFGIYESPVCSQCWARHVCGGGCYAENYFSTGDPLLPRPERCHLTKFMLYHSIEYLVKHSENASVLTFGETADC